MEKLFRNYENQMRRREKAMNDWRNAANRYKHALNAFAVKYHIPEQHQTIEFMHSLRNHPNIKQKFRRMAELAKIESTEYAKMRRLHEQVERAFHIPQNRWSVGISTIPENIRNLIRNERQRARRQNTSRMISILKEKNVPVNVIRHMFPKKS
jgi:hypothetical protein